MADAQPMTQNAQEIPSNVNLPMTPSANASAPVNTPPPPAAGAPSVWKNLAMGALWGLVGAGRSGALSGRQSSGQAFGEGVAGGVGGVLVDKPQFQAQQAQQAADIRFKNAQAADLQTQYAIHEAQLNHLPQEYQTELNEENLKMVQTLESLGLTPIAVTGDNPGDAQATGRNLTKNQGGVGNLYTVEVTQGGKTAHLSFDLDKITSGPQGLSLINQAERAQFGDSVTSPQLWSQMNPTQRVAATNQALHFLNPQITDRKGLDNAKAMLATLEAQKGNDAAAGLATKYEQAINTATPVIEQSETEANQRGAQADKLKKLAEEQTPAGQASLAKDQAQAAEASATAAALNQNRMPSVFGDVNKDPVTGSALTAGEGDKLFQSFNEKTLQPLQTSTEKSWQMAESAYDEYKAAGGKLPTGAQSMLLLSQHLSTTFGNVKGSRVTRDMIQEHLHARSVSDSALVAVQKLTNGDQLSPDQWKAFTGLIEQSRMFGYEAAIDQARALGIGKTIPAFLPKPQTSGAALDKGTAQIYLYAAGGNKDTARTAARQAGWTF